MSEEGRYTFRYVDSSASAPDYEQETVKCLKFGCVQKIVCLVESDIRRRLWIVEVCGHSYWKYKHWDSVVKCMYR